MVPVIEAACPAALMAGLGRPHRAPPPEPATAGRAVRVPAVTGGTDREEAIALPTGLLTEGLVHGGDARRTTADWTSCPNRGTTRTTGSVCRRARRSRGPGGPSGPSSSLPLRYPKQPGSGHNGGYGRRRPRGRKQPRPPGLAKPRRPRFHTAPTAVIYSGKQEPRTARDPAGASTIVQICALSSERQHLYVLVGLYYLIREQKQRVVADRLDGTPKEARNTKNAKVRDPSHGPCGFRGWDRMPDFTPFRRCGQIGSLAAR